MSQPALLDVNLLIALFDPDHVHHEAAHAWFGTHRSSGWATCPPSAERPAEVARRLASFRNSGDHVFWPDDVSLCDSRVFDLSVGHRHLTDVYLLALAVRRDGRLATLDRTIPAKAVRGARAAHLVVVDA